MVEPAKLESRRGRYPWITVSRILAVAVFAFAVFASVNLVHSSETCHFVFAKTNLKTGASTSDGFGDGWCGGFAPVTTNGDTRETSTITARTLEVSLGTRFVIISIGVGLAVLILYSASVGRAVKKALRPSAVRSGTLSVAGWIRIQAGRRWVEVAALASLAASAGCLYFAWNQRTSVHLTVWVPLLSETGHRNVLAAMFLAPAAGLFSVWRIAKRSRRLVGIMLLVGSITVFLVGRHLYHELDVSQVVRLVAG